MILELVFSAVGILFTIPGAVQDYISESDPHNYRIYFKLLPQLLLIAACGLRFTKQLLPGCVMSCALA